jgi:hypothetical protein
MISRRPAAHAARRNSLLAAMGEGIAIPLHLKPPAIATVSIRSATAIYYLTGLPSRKPCWCWCAKPRTSCLPRERTSSAKSGTATHGPGGAARPSVRQASPLPGLGRRCRSCFGPARRHVRRRAAGSRISAALNGVRALARTGVSAPAWCMTCARCSTQRLLQDDHEVALMRAPANLLAGPYPRDGTRAPGTIRVPGRGGTAA